MSDSKPFQPDLREQNRCSLVEALIPRTRSLNPYAYHLEQIDWLIFGTLTWEQDALTSYTQRAEDLRRKDFYRLIGLTCGRLGLRTRELAIYRKTEWGKGKRGHCNFLIARYGTHNVTASELAKTLQDAWTWGGKPLGRAKIEAFDSQKRLEAVTYQSKREFDSRGNELWMPEDFSPALKKLFLRTASATPHIKTENLPTLLLCPRVFL